MRKHIKFSICMIPVFVGQISACSANRFAGSISNSQHAAEQVVEVLPTATPTAVPPVPTVEPTKTPTPVVTVVPTRTPTPAPTATPLPTLTCSASFNLANGKWSTTFPSFGENGGPYTPSAPIHFAGQVVAGSNMSGNALYQISIGNDVRQVWMPCAASQGVDVGVGAIVPGTIVSITLLNTSQCKGSFNVVSLSAYGNFTFTYRGLKCPSNMKTSTLDLINGRLIEKDHLAF